MTTECVNCKANPVDIARKTPGTPTAKLIAILAAHGITNATDLAEIVGITDRAVRKVRNSGSGTQVPCGTPGPELQDRNGTQVPKTELQDRNSGSALACAESTNNKTNTKQTDSEKGLSDDKPKKARSSKTQFGRGEALTAFEAYNALALRCGIPQASAMTPGREKKIIARLRDFGLDGWQRALDSIEHSAFLTGRNDRNWRASLDFLVRPDAFAKVHDGGYGNGREVAGVRGIEASAYKPMPQPARGMTDEEREAWIMQDEQLAVAHG